MISQDFFEFLLISILSLGATFILFSKLSSYAQGRTKLVRGSIKYGGALGGFILVFSVLFFAWSQMAMRKDATDISLDGKWDLKLIRQDGAERSGTATIIQPAGSPRLQILGEVESTTTPPSVDFNSLVGLVRERRLVFLYENSRNEMGIGLATIQDNTPSRFTIYYYDVLSSNTNKDPEGRMILTRRQDGGS